MMSTRISISATNIQKFKKWKIISQDEVIYIDIDRYPNIKFDMRPMEFPKCASNEQITLFKSSNIILHHEYNSDYLFVRIYDSK